MSSVVATAHHDSSGGGRAVRRTAIAVSAIVLAGQPTAAMEASAPPSRPKHPTIVVKAGTSRGPAPTHLLGANHNFDSNGRGLWDPRSDAPVPAVVTGARRAGLQAMRFPGGTGANMYDWKRAIGPEHGCQVVGPQRRGDQAFALTRGLAFGPDELMRFVDMVGAEANIMVPFVNETPGDAADWVEYMNGRAGVTGNPNGGVDWADVRAANGHPSPYGIRWWEIGNEQHHRDSRYWMSRDHGKALRQYAFGGRRLVRGEYLGKECAHPRAGIPSDGSAAQTFGVLYPPVAPRSVRAVIDGQVWTRVPSLSSEGPDARVFTLDAENGRMLFGDGAHGAIPPQGSRVRASYRSVHQGYFAFARRMKEVDPSIHVCSSWGEVAFNRVVAHRKYDCMAAHANVPFSRGNESLATWSGPLEGHDQFMIKSGSILRRVGALRATMPPATPLHLTEFTAIHGDSRAWPAWSASVSHAVYMSSLWANWLNLRIPWGNGDAFLWAGQRGVLGGRPDYTFTADAVTRQALAPMFSAGGALLRSRIVGNPIRRPRLTAASDSYPALTVAATRARGVMSLLVANRLPGKDVSTHIRLDGRRARGTANVRTVVGQSFRSWNQPDRPPSVRLRVRSRDIGPTGFHYRFPPASTTVFRIPLR
jgi:alpha-N-arabinofuranosidase